MFDGYQKLRSLNKSGTLIQAQGPSGQRVTLKRVPAEAIEQQSERLGQFELDSIPRVLDLGHSFLILEPMAGRTLSESESSLSSLQILSLGLQMSRLLNELAVRGESEITVDPEHILWDRDGGRLWLIELNCSSSGSQVVSKIQNLLKVLLDPSDEHRLELKRLLSQRMPLAEWQELAASHRENFLQVQASLEEPPGAALNRLRALRSAAAEVGDRTFCERASGAVSALLISTGMDLPEVLSSDHPGIQRLRLGPTAAQRVAGAAQFLETSVEGFASTSALYFNCLDHLISTEKSNGFSLAREALRQWEGKSCEAYSHRLLLLRAERARINQSKEARLLFDRAAAAAVAGNSVIEEALTLERTASFHGLEQRPELAAEYQKKAEQAYARWQNQAEPINSNIGLELTRIVRLCGEISAHGEARGLWSQLAQLALKNTKAERVCVVHTKPALKLYFEVTESGAHGKELPTELLETVLQERTSLLIEDALQSKLYQDDLYLKEFSPRSILCCPVSHRGQLHGLLYLEHCGQRSVFGKVEQDLVALLSAHTAVALEHEYLEQAQGDQERLESANQELAAEVLRLSETERGLHETAQRTQLQTKERNALLADLSHEFRAPMGAVLGITKRLLKTEHPMEQTLLLETVADSAESVLLVANSFLDLLTLEAGELAFEHRAFELSRVLKRASQLHQAYSGTLTVQFHLQACPQYLCGDELRLSQVLYHLLEQWRNSESSGELAVSAERQGEFVEFTLIGQSEAPADSLGLQISRALLEAMGGDLISKGGCTKFRLPMVAGTKPLDLPELPQGLRVLLVEDNELSRYHTLGYLLEWGCQVDCAVDGRQAVQMAQERYDLILMDQQLPFLDGRSATRMLRHQVPKKVMIVALSGQDPKPGMDFDEWLSKPLKPRQLHDTLSNLSAQPSPAEQMALAEPSTLASTSSRKQVSIASQDLQGPTLKIPTQLYGRELEQEKIQAAWEQAASGTRQLVLVSGSAGIGKSRLWQSLRETVLDRGGLLLEGKCDQYRPLPYMALRQALSGFVRQLLGLEESELLSWKVRLEHALAGDQTVLSDLIPGLELLLGPMPELPALPTAELQSLFNAKLKDLLRVLASPQHPLVLILDDLQWSDPQTLILLDQIASEHGLDHLLIVGTHRPTDLVDVLKPDLELRLEALAGMALESWLQDFLAREDVEELAELCLEKAGGNPFFTIQVLQSALKSGLLKASEGRWDWEYLGFRLLPGMGELGRLMLDRLSELTAAARRTLDWSACIGGQFELVLLLEVYPDADLAPSLQAGLVLPTNTEGLFRFFHDKVQQTAYEEISIQERESMHRRLGHRLLARQTLGAKDEDLFPATDQLNAGLGAISSDEERLILAELNLLTGRRALRSHALDDARTKLGLGIELLGPDPWRHYQLALDLHSEAALAASARNDAEAVRHLAEILDRQALNVLDRVLGFEVRFLYHLAQLEFEEALDLQLEALSLLGVQLEPYPSKIQSAWTVLKTRSFLGQGSLEALEDGEQLTCPKLLAATRILVGLVPTTMASRPGLFVETASQLVLISAKKGLNPAAGMAVASWGMVMMGVGEISVARKYSELAERLSRRPEERAYRGHVLGTIAQGLLPWCEPFRQTWSLLQRASEYCYQLGDLDWGGWAILGEINARLCSGDTADISLREMGTKKRLRLLPHHREIEALFVQTQSAETHTGHWHPRSYRSIDERPFETQNATQRNAFRYATYNITKGILCHLHGYHEEGASHTLEVTNLGQAIAGLFVYAEACFWDSLNCLSLPKNNSTLSRWKRNIRHRKNLNFLKKRLPYCTANLAHRVYLLEAEAARRKNKAIAAAELYDLSIAAARKQGDTRVEALALEKSGFFHETMGSGLTARFYFERAAEAWIRNGLTAKAHQLEKHIDGRLGWQSREKDGSHLLIEAAKFLAQNVEPNEPVEKLLWSCLELTNSSSVTLLLKGEPLVWRARLSVGLCEIVDPPRPIETCPDFLHEQTVRYAFRTGEMLVTEEPSTLACLPVLLEGIVEGVLCLESDGAATNLDACRILARQSVLTSKNSLHANRRVEREKAEHQRDHMTSKLESLLETKIEAQQVAQTAEREFTDRRALALQVSELIRQALIELRQATKSLLTESLEEQELLYLRAVERCLVPVMKLNQGLGVKGRVSQKQGSFSDFSLHKLVHEVIDLLRPNAQDRDTELHIEYTAPKMIVGSPEDVRQVLTNLISNAIKATSDGLVTLRVCPAEDIGIQIIVEDTGVGMTPEVLESALKPFARPDRSRSGGLGLSICQRTVEESGGTLKIASVLGEGSSFTVELPYLEGRPERGTLNLELALQAAGGNQKLMHRFLNSLLKTLAQQKDQLEEALNLDDVPTLLRLGHSLKNGAAQVGATELEGRAEKLEAMAETSAIESCRVLLPELLISLENLERELSSFLVES